MPFPMLVSGACESVGMWLSGGMAEWFKAAVLKTVVPLAAEPWVRILLPPPITEQQKTNGEMAESAEGARLLSECRVKSSTEGSNPSLSATKANRLPDRRGDSGFFVWT